MAKLAQRLAVMPLLVRSGLRLDSNGKVCLQLERTGMPLSNNFFADLLVNTDREYNAAFRYTVSKHVSLSTNYDSDYKWDTSLTLH